MTISAIVPDPWNHDHPDDRYCPFDLVPGSNGCWLLWWPKRKNLGRVVSFIASGARVVIIGTDDYHSQPGWDRSMFPLDVKVALKRQQKKTGRLPQFELSETSNIFDLYVPLGLGFKALARLSHWEVGTRRLDQRMIDDYCPLVAQFLSGAGCGLEPAMIARMTPIVTELLLRQTKAQLDLEEESRTQRPTQAKLKASKVRKMGKGRLLGVVRPIRARYRNRRVQRHQTQGQSCLIANLAALGLLKE